MFLVVFRFSSPAFLIRLRGFLPSSHFPLTISPSTELVSKEKGNCNNVTLKAKVPKRKLHDNNHLELHFSQLKLYRDTSSSQIPIWSHNSFFFYTLDFLHTYLLTYLSHYYVCILAGRIFCLHIYLRLSTC